MMRRPPGTPREESAEREHAYLIDDPAERDAILARSCITLLARGLDPALVSRVMGVPRERLEDMVREAAREAQAKGK